MSERLDLTTSDRHYIKMTETPVPKLIYELATPTIISMLVASLYNLVTTFYVGQVDTQSTAAVGISFSVMAIIQALGFFFGHGAGNYVSRQLGKRDEEGAQRMAATGFFTTVVCGIVVMIAGELFLTPLCHLLGSTPTIQPYIEKYLSILLFSAPIMAASFFLNNLLRYQGNARYAMVGIVCGAVLNILIAPVFIFVMGWGIAGAAWATVLCESVSLLVLWIMTTRRGIVPISVKNITLKGAYFREICRGGLPSLARQGLASVAILLLNLSASVYGDDAIAGMSIVTRVIHFIYAFFLGFCQGYQPLCGFNYGAGKYTRVLDAFWFCVKVGTSGLILCSAFGVWFAEDIVRLFRDAPDVVEVGKAALTYQFLVYPLNIFMTMSSMTLQTIGKARPAVVLASARQGVFFIPAILLLPRVCGLVGVEIALPVADVFSFILAILLIKGTLKGLAAFGRQEHLR